MLSRPSMGQLMMLPTGHRGHTSLCLTRLKYREFSPSHKGASGGSKSSQRLFMAISREGASSPPGWATWPGIRLRPGLAPRAGFSTKGLTSRPNLRVHVTALRMANVVQEKGL